MRTFIALGAVMLLMVSLSGLAGWSFLNRAHTPNYVTTTDEYATGSLRWALGTAHEGNTITFDPSLAGQTIVLQNADVHIIQKNLVIEGPTTGHITIREIGASLMVDTPASVIISGVAFQGSNTKDQLELISNQGKLWLNNCTVSGNTATSGVSGGIYNGFGGTLTLNSSTVSGNTATSSSSGGIFNYGTLWLNSSTVSGNTATSGSSGGGIFIRSFVDTSGAVFVAYVDLTFSTIYGNTAHGGDITIKDVDTYGEDIKQVSQVKIRNSIVASHPAHPGPDISGTLISSGYNLFQDNSGATFDPATRTQHGTDKLLSVNDLIRVFASPVALQDNGRPTKTLALAPDSPAVDQIPLAACHINGITTDQRGMKRPGDDKNKCDIGAFESQTHPPDLLHNGLA